MRRASRILGSVWLSALAIATPTYAAVIFSDSGAGNTFNLEDGYLIYRNSGSSPGGPAEPRVAASFTPSITGRLDTVSLAAGFATGTFTSLNQLDLNLRADAAVSPRSIIESFRISNQMTGRGLNQGEPVSATSILQPILSSGTRYWLEASVPTNPDPGNTTLVIHFNSSNAIGLVQTTRGNGFVERIVPALLPAFSLDGTPAEFKASYLTERPVDAILH